jgi:TldD protein
MKNEIFQPFKQHLDHDKTQELLRKILRSADDGEIFFEEKRSESLVLDDQTLKSANLDASKGFGVRAVKGEATAYAHSTDISEKSLLRAAETIKLLSSTGDAQYTPPPSKTTTKLYEDIDPIIELPFSSKVDLLKEIDDYARGLDKRVVQVSASVAASVQNILIMRQDCDLKRDTRPLTRINISISVEEMGRRETGSAGGGGRYALSLVTEPVIWRGFVKEALRIAVLNLQAEAAPAGVADVVLGPGWPGILLHEAVGHGLEGDFNRKNTSAFANLMGKQVAAKGVTVVDDGTIPDRRGSISFDDEGTPSAKNTLIDDGILVGYMQDRQNARLMGTSSTGNGRRQSYAHPPMPRMTNTYMLNGTDKVESMITSLKNGIYAVGFGGGQVDITNGKFVFSCTEAYKVNDGKIGAPVKGATLIGDGASALKEIRAIGDDMSLDPGMGTCGKAGQWVPVGVGQPSLLIGGLTIGGSQT